MIRLPAEWEPQSAILLTWPHLDTDWQSMLNEIEHTYLDIVETLSNYTPIVIAVPPSQLDDLEQKLARNFNHKPFRVKCYGASSNDVWARDHGPIAIENNRIIRLLDFTFNGWGNKFSADYDNQITQTLHRQGAFGTTPLTAQNIVLEGGAIDSDGKGCLLTTRQCLCHPNRNPNMSQADIEQYLKRHLGVEKILWLEHGYLAGDDTDSHVDTLARFAPNDTIVYVSCNEPKDEHFLALKNMREQLQTFTNCNNQAFKLIALPWPAPKFADDGHRLPATYANYLITNNAVLVPTYQDKNDALALEQIAKAYPDRTIEGLDCSNLIQQHGSLHCITMQIPKLASDYV